MRKTIKAVTLLGAMALLLTACSSSDATNGGSNADPASLPGGDGCTSLVIAASSEKVNLMEELGQAFQESSEAKGLDNCATVYPINVSSGNATKALSANQEKWADLQPEYYPTMWTPASSVWIDRVKAATNAGIVSDATNFAQTPVVFGVPETMAEALGYPEKELSYADLATYINNPNGWSDLGKPLWGSFKIAKTNPNTSTTGLSVILTQAYAASGKKADLTPADIEAAKDFSRSFELGAIHYGDTTGKVLNTLYSNTQNGTSGSSYVSAIALEETSLFWYNKGNPDSHVVEEGEVLTPPKEKLIAVYPTEGSMVSDNPIVTLNTKWVTEEQKTASEAFKKFLNTKTAQEILPTYGFRPLDENVDTSKSLNADVGIDVTKPVTILPQPDTTTVSAAIDQWAEIRKPSAVLELIDISGSMDEKISGSQTRLEGAIEGATSTINNLRSNDEIGVWAFTTGLSSDVGKGVVSVYDFGPLNGNKEKLGNSIEELIYSDRQGTPMFDAVSTAYDFMSDKAEPGRINAIVLLSDGADTDSNISLESLLVKLNADDEKKKSNPVRIFTIAYGSGADTDTLKKIASATGGQSFEATDPMKIREVFESVMNNF